MSNEDSFYPTVNKLVGRCERKAINELRSIHNRIDEFTDPWKVPDVDSTHYRYLNKLIIYRLVDSFASKHTVIKNVSVRHYHDQVSTGKVFLHVFVDTGTEATLVGFSLPRMIMNHPIWYPNYFQRHSGYWRGAVCDQLHWEAGKYLGILKHTFKRWLTTDDTDNTGNDFEFTPLPRTQAMSSEPGYPFPTDP